MRLRHSLHPFKLCAMIAIALLAAPSALAQTTVFTHQGKLEFDGVPANGSFDFQFKLFDAASGGAQQGATVEQLNITVSDGDYKVLLDFGPGAFPGPDRYLEVGYRLSGSSTYTTQTPRQPITSAPYAIRSLVATTADGLSVTCSSCVTSNQIQSVQGGQVSGTIPVASLPAGSANYIQNTTVQQAASNFNISGSGTAGTLSANVVSATTQYNMSGQRVLVYDATVDNLFVGVNAGNANGCCHNAFFGTGAGQNNTLGGYLNSFFGTFAGLNNQSGSANSFFGGQAGQNNTTGSQNAFFGVTAGWQNTTGGSNSFFGDSAGQHNTTGADNSFFGNSAGALNTTASNNSFFGVGAGANNKTGENNSFFGNSAGALNTTASNNSFFGRWAGLNNTTGNSNAFFGEATGSTNTTGSVNAFFGQSAGLNNTSGNSNSFFGVAAGHLNQTGTGNTFIGHLADFSSVNPTGDNNTLLGRLANVDSGVSNATAIGANAHATASHTLVLGTDQEVVIIPGKLEVDTLGVAGSQPLCLNNSKRLAPCSSSLRYKTALRPFAAGLSIINRLQPISFTWKEGGMRDLGFGAEAVARVEPLLVTRNAGGEIEGVKYDRVAVVMVNAIKEQQQQIAAQQEQVAELPLIKAENARLRAQLADVLARLGRLEMRLAARK